MQALGKFVNQWGSYEATIDPFAFVVSWWKYDRVWMVTFILAGFGFTIDFDFGPHPPVDYER